MVFSFFGYPYEKGGMTVKRFCSMALIVSLVFLMGCSDAAPAPSKPSVVTGVTVSYENGSVTAQRYYTSDCKIRSVLNYLRWIDPYGVPEENPELSSGSSFHIVLSYSDGREKLYRQKSDRYFLEEGKPWQNIDPNKAISLSQMLGELESDQ